MMPSVNNLCSSTSQFASLYANTHPQFNMLPQDPDEGDHRLRRGKWTDEEVQYTDKMISMFKRGTLELPEGVEGNHVTLRSYLSHKLMCAPMRITKKYTGSSCLGKCVYNSCEVAEGVTQEEIDADRAELAELEARHLAKLQNSSRGRRGGGAHTEGLAELRVGAVSTPGIDAMMTAHLLPPPPQPCLWNMPAIGYPASVLGGIQGNFVPMENFALALDQLNQRRLQLEAVKQNGQLNQGSSSGTSSSGTSSSGTNSSGTSSSGTSSNSGGGDGLFGIGFGLPGVLGKHRRVDENPDEGFVHDDDMDGEYEDHAGLWGGRPHPAFLGSSSSLSALQPFLKRRAAMSSSLSDASGGTSASSGQGLEQQCNSSGSEEDRIPSPIHGDGYVGSVQRVQVKATSNAMHNDAASSLIAFMSTVRRESEQDLFAHDARVSSSTSFTALAAAGDDVFQAASESPPYSFFQ